MSHTKRFRNVFLSYGNQLPLFFKTKVSEIKPNSIDISVDSEKSVNNGQFCAIWYVIRCPGTVLYESTARLFTSWVYTSLAKFHLFSQATWAVPCHKGSACLSFFGGRMVLRRKISDPPLYRSTVAGSSSGTFWSSRSARSSCASTS